MKFWIFIKRDPIPIFALLMLVVGLVFFFIEHQVIWAHRIWFVGLIGGGIPIVYHTCKGILHGEFASDIVAMLAIITAVFLNEAFAGAVVVLMQSGGEAMERYGFRRASSSLEELFKRAPRKARRKDIASELVEEIDATQVRIGDVLVVRPGEMIPVDGTVIRGQTEIDESAITGEPIFKQKQEGGALLSGSVNVSGAIEMRADQISEKSQYAKIVKLVKKAQEEKAPIQRLADRYAIVFTPLTLCMAALGFWITSDLVTVLAVLVVATPCPLILATPLAVICGINQAAKEGIIVKGGSPIEQVAQTQAVLFDKTGTITFGEPRLESILVFDHVKENEILQSAAAIEQLSTHSIAKAIVKKGLEKSPKLPAPKNFKEIPGYAVSGELDGHLYTIGSSALLDKEFLAKWERKFLSLMDQNNLLVFVLKDGFCIGALVLTDHIRPEAASTMLQLHQLGVQEIMMVTGDHKKSAEAIAKKAGILDFAAQLLPEQKVEIVNEFKEKYKILTMVGDGINDAPALATATVGIAMGAHGTAISAEAADIVLLIDDLSKVAKAVRIGQRMLKIAKQSIFVGMGLSFVLMGIACFGYIAPPVGAGLQEIIDVVVILNALRVLKPI